MNNIAHKNDQELMQSALDLLKERYIDLKIDAEEYAIKVWWNKNTAAYVDFTKIIRYVPIGKKETELEYDIIVNLTNNTILPFEKPILGKQFYIPTESDLKALAFVKEHFGVFSLEFINTIIEEAEEYKISCKSESVLEFYTLNKKTDE